MRGSAALWTALAALLVAGCEKLPWETSNASTTATPVEAPPALPPRPSVAPTEVLATVNDKLISRRDMELALQELRATTEALGQTWQPLPVEERADQYDLHDLMNDLILAELRAQDALARGLDRSADTQHLFFYRYRSLFAQEWVRWQLDRITVPQAEIEQYYTSFKEGFSEPELIRVRQIVLASEDQAKATLVKLLEGMDFLEVARQMALPGRLDAAQGPLVEKWVVRNAQRGRVDPTITQNIRDLTDSVLEQAAFAIDKVGGVSNYVKGPDNNFHIFQLVERKPGRQKTLLEVSKGIEDYLRFQKLSELNEELKTKARIERFPERLEGLTQ